MFLRLDRTSKKIVVGKSMMTTFLENRTAELWQWFMPRLKSVPSRKGTHLLSLEVFNTGYFNSFSPAKPFQKWAGVEVEQGIATPEDMETLIIPEGDYAVFLHKGTHTEAKKTYDYIFMEWLPSSGFTLDDRPHFAVMDERYKKNDPTSEEEIWIPIRKEKID